MKPTSTPYVQQGSPLADGMISTTIGTPIDILREPSSPAKFDYNTLRMAGYPSTHNLPMQQDDPVFRHITHPRELAISRRIIEIGAMAVTDRSTINPSLEQVAERNDPEPILQKLEDIERHLLQDKDEDHEALKACTMIREALAQKIEDENV